MKNHISTFAIFSLSLCLDIFTKHLVVSRFNLYDKLDFLNGFFRITLVYNEGGVFGIFQGYKSVFLIISIVVLIIMILYFIMENNNTLIFKVSMALIISGAIGNIIDRLIPGRPGVVDFISIGVDGIYRWPSFNVADTVIITGAFMLIISFYKDESKRKKLEKSGKSNQ